MITTVTGRNQVTIPAELARRCGIEPGVRIEWMQSEEPNRITLTIRQGRRQIMQSLRRIGRRTRKDGRDSAEELARQREREDLERAKGM